MKITVVLTRDEVKEAVQDFLMNKGLDEGCIVISMKSNGIVETSQPIEFTFEVSNEADARS